MKSADFSIKQPYENKNIAFIWSMYLYENRQEYNTLLKKFSCSSVDKSTMPDSAVIVQDFSSIEKIESDELFQGTIILPIEDSGLGYILECFRITCECFRVLYGHCDIQPIRGYEQINFELILTEVSKQVNTVHSELYKSYLKENFNLI